MVSIATEVRTPSPPPGGLRSRVNPFVLITGTLGVILIGLIIWVVGGIEHAAPDPSVQEDPPKDAIAPWTLEVFGWALWIGVWAGGVVSVVRNRRLTPWVICLIASQTMWWQEWYADWGAYLEYSPEFDLIPWGHTFFTSPNKPWVLIAVYGWYFQLIPWMLHKVQWARTKVPNLPNWVTLIGVGGTLFYLENLVFEGLGATQMGWWSYTQHWGPSFDWENGTWPFLGPGAIFTIFGVCAIWLLDKRTEAGDFKMDVWSGAIKVRAGWRRELARATAWILTFNALYIITLLTPLILARTFAFGRGSFYVP